MLHLGGQRMRFPRSDPHETGNGERDHGARLQDAILRGQADASDPAYPRGAMYLILPLLLASANVAPVQLANSATISSLPRTQNGGTWDSGHVQGVAVDVRGGYIYYSFTNLLAKYDFSGKLIGTLVGWTGHLGDLDFNPADGKVYGSLGVQGRQGLLHRRDRREQADRSASRRARARSSAPSTCPKWSRTTADINGDGVFDGERQVRRRSRASPDHRYGCSGMDGVSFGPAFGRTDGKRYLTVAYGVYGNTKRGPTTTIRCCSSTTSPTGPLRQPADRGRAAPSRPRGAPRQIFRPHRQYALWRAEPDL
jgi:hypothetical protein